MQTQDWPLHSETSKGIRNLCDFESKELGLGLRFRNMVSKAIRIDRKMEFNGIWCNSRDEMRKTEGEKN